jgi:hypothetical protein
MSLLDWIVRKQKKSLDSEDALRSVEEKVDSIERKVADNLDQQIRTSSFSSVQQRDSIVMRYKLGAPSRDLAEVLAVPPAWKRGDKA